MDIVYYIGENGKYVAVSKNRFYEQMRYYKNNCIPFCVKDLQYYGFCEPDHKEKYLSQLIVS